MRESLHRGHIQDLEVTSSLAARGGGWRDPLLVLGSGGNWSWSTLPGGTPDGFATLQAYPNQGFQEMRNEVGA